VSRFDQFEHASLTDVGVRRSHNQDNLAVHLASDEAQWEQRGHLFLVADGMGAHAVGEKASEQAASVVPHIYHKHTQEGPASALRKAFVEANASIHSCGQQNREFQGMGTTSSALLLRPEGAWIAHVGDSRVYRIRAGWIEQLTYDHSLVWEYARIKKIDPAEVVDIPSNVIHRCLGPEPLVQVDVAGPHPVQPGDTFLVCSDGLSGQVSDPEMGAIVSALPPAEACRYLVDLANLRGGPDNITVIVVRVGGVPEANGTVAKKSLHRQWRRTTWNLLIGRSRYPWPLLCLLGGILMVADSIILSRYGRLYALLAFGAAAAVIVAGLVGLAVHYRREQRRQVTAAEAESAQLTEPHVHRRAQCRIGELLVEKVTKDLDILSQAADERNWEADRETSSQHRRQANNALRATDYPTAFREMCLAMLPFTRALEKQRQKAEVFRPLWDGRDRPDSLSRPK
jgi:serine/threonine protein phosphatase PrpC